jgi:hypothetical protein
MGRTSELDSPPHCHGELSALAVVATVSNSAERTESGEDGTIVWGSFSITSTGFVIFAAHGQKKNLAKRTASPAA